jgi:TrbM
MNKCNFLLPVLFTISTALLAGNAIANPIACMAVICLSNVPGAIPQQCQSARKSYFIIQIWSPYYNAPATAQARDMFLRTCPFVPSMGSVEPSLIYIRGRYGMYQSDPGV